MMNTFCIFIPSARSTATNDRMSALFNIDGNVPLLQEETKVQLALGLDECAVAALRLRACIPIWLRHDSGKTMDHRTPVYWWRATALRKTLHGLKLVMKRWKP